MSSHYDEDDSLDIRVHRPGHSPRPIRYVQNPPVPRTYYGVPTSPNHFMPEQHTTVVTRARSRDRRTSPPAAVPVIINNRIYNEHTSEEDDSDDGHHHGRKEVALHRHMSRRGSKSRSRSRSQSRSRSSRLTREQWEAEQARRELERMHIAQAREKDERRLAKEYRDEADLLLAKRELEEIKKRELQVEGENRIKKELELKRLKGEEEVAEERRRREKEAQDAVEKYKKAEKERIAREESQKEQFEKEYKRRLQDDLVKSGFDEKTISAILSKQKIPENGLQLAEPAHAERPTYTRMARRYLSIETLQTFRIEYDLDADPEYVLIKRWVPEWEQDQFWQHTKSIREKRGKTLMVGEKKNHNREPEFEWVRKKHDRRRSKSPSLLMYLAGARPT